MEKQTFPWFRFNSRPFLSLSASPRKSPAKKQKEANVEKTSLKTWPSIPIKDITRISKAVLAKVSSEDTGGHFTIQVLESYPYLADDYLETVDEPMDFRTIEEERIPQYKGIKDLQRDFCLIFDNCSGFNGAETEMGQYAMYVLRRNKPQFHSAVDSFSHRLLHTAAKSGTS
jgi:hypothetical protein